MAQARRPNNVHTYALAMTQGTPSALLATLVVLTGAVVGCGRMFDTPRPAVVRYSSTIPPSRFKVIAGVAGGASRTDFQIAATVRKQLSDSGLTVIRRAGRWDNQAEAVRAICAPGQDPAVDGVLFTWFNRLELIDCTTEETAFAIGGEGGSGGITAMTERLSKWLKGEAEPAPKP